MLDNTHTYNNYPSLHQSNSVFIPHALGKNWQQISKQMNKRMVGPERSPEMTEDSSVITEKSRKPSWCLREKAVEWESHRSGQEGIDRVGGKRGQRTSKQCSESPGKRVCAGPEFPEANQSQGRVLLKQGESSDPPGARWSRWTLKGPHQ